MSSVARTTSEPQFLEKQETNLGKQRRLKMVLRGSKVKPVEGLPHFYTLKVFFFEFHQSIKPTQALRAGEILCIGKIEGFEGGR